jgi:hypothetical protein
VAPRRRLGAALQESADRLNELLRQTITRHPLVPAAAPGGAGRPDRMQLSLRVYGRPGRAPLRTRFGPMGLYLGQVCEMLTAAATGAALVTVKYRYALYLADEDEPFLRWEYDARPTDPGALWCGQHLQGLMRLPVTANGVPLNDLHLPTGQIAIDEVVRFCIVDLGVEPLSENWNELLMRSVARRHVSVDD